ncbi:2-oxodicarboxylate carrier 1-related [Anaeramoeba flamelloides]|uniref:2-oxodicarboxylate carrier 1-related n=1 Tax=Anaeramoeba flamelloides TaxID=1746091 RepID=A0AAV7ZTN6_9EUKA|nr:2-oxodicarboxylate carrier 1-related [Anaeramoeba flamelloides]
MHTQCEDDKPSKWLQNGYYHLVGGSVGLIAGTIVVSANGVEPSTKGALRSFFRSGIETMVFENLGNAVRNNMSEYKKRKEYWKISIVSGVVVAAGNSFISTIFNNVYSYQDKNPDQETNIPYKTAYNMIKKEGFKSLFDGYFSRAYSKILFLPTLKLISAYNNRQLLKIFSNPDSFLERRVLLPFLKGTISGIETSILIKPIDETLRSLVRKKKVSFKKIQKKTWNQIRFAAFDIGLESLLYSNAKYFLSPSKLSFKNITKIL